jgi:hypothetical protein
MKKALVLAVTMVVVMGKPLAAAPAVPICMTERPDRATEQAQMIASKIFAGIGVNLEWHNEAAFCEAHPAQALVIRYSHHTSKTFLPGALANALPFEGVHIEIFYDRMLGAEGEVRVEYLGHVLSHEITHMLQYTARHSATGVMKAHWDNPEMMQMKSRPLGFTKLDVELIYAGLAKRQAKNVTVALADGIK